MFDYVREAIKQADAEAAEYARWREKRQLRLQSAEPAKVKPQKPNENRVTQDTVTRAEMCAHIQQAIEGAISIVGEEVGTNEKRLREEIAELRVEIDTLRKRITSIEVTADDTVIVDLPPPRQLRMIGGRDA
jgi:hypothetical protein